MNQSTISTPNRVIAGLLGGLLGGVALGIIVTPPFGFVPYLIISAILGAIFGLVFGPQINSTGAGFVWGEAFGTFWWLIGVLTLLPLFSGQGLKWTVEAADDAFPLLLGHIMASGALMGLSYHLISKGQAPPPLWPKRGPGLPLLRFLGMPGGAIKNREESTPTDKKPMGQAIAPPIIQALIVGGIGGLLGSWVFLAGIDRANFLPLIAGITGSQSYFVGLLLHYGIGAIIGMTFGMLFDRDVKGSGSGIIWGLNYGLFWWMLGPQTLLPILLNGTLPTWSLERAQALVPSLMAHILYGSLVGLFYALINKLWRVLFIDSDPLNRTREGAGTRGVRGIVMGIIGGTIGGLLFTLLVASTQSNIASLIQSESIVAGLIVHLLISIMIGISFGLLFQDEAESLGSGMAWGLTYGILWWVLGAVTLFPYFLRVPVVWSIERVINLYPSLLGHLLYGASLGFFFQLLARRYDERLQKKPHNGKQSTPKRRASGTPAAALWAMVLTLAIILPLMLQPEGMESDSEPYSQHIDLEQGLVRNGD